MLSNESLISRNSNIPTINLDGEVAMMNIEKGKYYGFNSIASRIWELIEEPKTYKDIIDILLSEFNVDASTCEQHVREFLEKLVSEGLVIVDN